MKQILLSLLLCLALPTFAAEGEWLTDFKAATEKARAEKKLVLLDFTGSDWCPPCRALHKNVLTSEAFATFAKANLVLVEVDFPRSKEMSAAQKTANKELAQKFGIRGYPTVIMLDADGKEVFKQVGYGGEAAQAYVAKLEKAAKK